MMLLVLAAGQLHAQVTITLADALARAKVNSPQFQAAVTGLGLAQQDRVQARAALLPGVDYRNSFIYTQPNGTPSGRFIGNNGPREYISQGVAHSEIGLGLLAEYRRAAAAQALAKAKAEVAARGLAVTVIQNFYGLLAAQRKRGSAQQAFAEAQHFLDLSRHLEQGGEVAHSDAIKAQLQANDRQRDLDEARLAEQKTRLALAVLLFPNPTQDFTVADDFDAAPSLPSKADSEQLAQKNNAELRAAFAAVSVANREVLVARSAHLPTIALDYFYGIDAPQFATRSDGMRNLGYAAAATVNLPVWSWGATQSKVRQAQLRRHQAQVELSAAQRQALADLESVYSEAQLARSQLDVLRTSVDLATESLRLTNLRYQAGESAALEVVDAQNSLTAARNAYSDGAVRYRLALANLQTLTGNF